MVQILLNSGRQAEAETEIRQAIELSKTDPDRWITLVRFMVVTKQLAKAQKAIKDAESAIPPDQVPLALAQCCEMMGRAYEQSGDGATKQWYARATEWFEKAKAAHPDDFSIVRRLTGFYLQTKQIAKAEAQLNAILKRCRPIAPKRRTGRLGTADTRPALVLDRPPARPSMRLLY